MNPFDLNGDRVISKDEWLMFYANLFDHAMQQGYAIQNKKT